METMISMADTLETLELHAESQAAIAEARAIGNRALGEDSTSQLHLHQSIAACTKLGTVLGTAKNNRIGIQLQGEQRQISIQIVNISY